MRFEVVRRVLLLTAYICQSISSSNADVPGANQRMSFRNWNDIQSRGYCGGISTIESRFASFQPSRIFNANAPRDSAFTVEQKLRAFLRGELVVFNGYDSLKDISSQHEKIFMAIAKEIQLEYAENYNRNTPNPSGATPTTPKAESEYWPSVFKSIDNGQAVVISVESLDGRFAHGVSAVAYQDKGEYFEITIRDPNNSGLSSLRVDKDTNGRPGSQGYYKTAVWGRGIRVNFVSSYHNKMFKKIDSTPQYSQSETSVASERAGQVRSHAR